MARCALAAALLFGGAAASGAPFCAQCANGGAPPMDNTYMRASCDDAAATLDAVVFASYGTASGQCPSFASGACNAANSSSVVAAACVGQRTCEVFPNTTTFGDPCFGTVKTLSVVLTCSSGAGAATCGVAPPPPPPPPPTGPTFAAAVSVDWSRITASSQVTPSLQVVSQHFLWRTSAIHDQSFATLKAIGAARVRWVPWVPYAQHGVGELMPPSQGYVCGPQNWAAGGQVEPLTLDCGAAGGAITAVSFASFGQPSGNCGAYAKSASCHAASSEAVVAKLCVGQQSCVVPTDAASFGGAPCGGANWLAVQVTCTNDVLHTYWNMTLPDQFFSDTWEALDGDNTDPIPNYSTQPTWLYSPRNYDWNADPAQPWDYSRGPAAACNNTLLGDYYGRLYGYFKTGSMVDEAGVTHTRPGGAANIRTIEVFNEVDYEHNYDVVSYTAAFDAVVKGVRKHADPGKSIRFVGLSLPNIDGADKVVAWATYFLNASNHDPECVDALNYIGYHAYPTNGPYSPDPTSFELMFDYVDAYIAEVKRVDAVIAALSPDTRTVLDETGTDMDGVLGPGPPPGNNARYWVAAAGYHAYMFARAANESSTVVQVGASQFMDAPGQEPSVTMVDWSSGLGTARAWMVKLLRDSLQINDSIFATSVACSGGGALFAMAFSTPDQNVKSVLLVNKRNAFANVTVDCGSGPCGCAALSVIDENTGLAPARSDPCPGGADGMFSMAPFATAVMLLQ